MTAVESVMLPAAAPKPAAEESPARRAFRRLLRRKGAVVGLVVVLTFISFALLANVIAPYSPVEADWSALRGAPTPEHPFGGDELGRDVLSRVIHGAQASLFAGVVSVFLAMLIGIPVGLLSGYAGGLVDGFIMRFTDAMLAVPFLILAIAMAAFLGPSLTNAMIAIGIAAAPIFVRLTRAQVQAVKMEDYVEAARAVGNSPLRIAFRHILPNIWPALMVQATLTIASAIIAEASLSFLGLGQQPPEPSWGSMLNTAKDYMTDAPWMAVYPGISIFIVVLSFNLLGDGLRDALDPRHRE
ncbi:ABC transporter permease [Ferrovibrio terrae]|uniref:ABC transporter permease n=1 Tax=Ferrovibrio terrae TaxID=2594003 RepID=UPI00313793C8